MARQVEADRRQLLIQFVRPGPGLDALQARPRGARLIRSEQADLRRGPLGGDALAIGNQGVGLFEQLAAVGVQAVEGPGLGQAFQRPLVDRLGINSLQEVEDVDERSARIADLDDVLHRLQTHVADGAQGIENAALPVLPLHIKVGGRPVDVRGQNRNLEATAILIENRQLVGVRQVEAHRGGEEFDWVIGLQPARLERNQRIGGGVRLVEAVTGELGHQVEDGARLSLRHRLLGGALDEAEALEIHLLLLLLAHGAAQKVGFPQAVARQDLGDLHHLFLIDDDAVGLGQDIGQRRVQIVHLSPPELPVDIGVDHLHRPRPVERNQRGDFLDGAAAHLAQRVAHAL